MHEDMHYSDDYKYIPMTSINSGLGQEVLKDLYCYTIQIVNICFVGNPEKNDEWILIDAGMPKSANKIVCEAENRFGSKPPKMMILTHGHFDHVGAIVDLVNYWHVPVYAHELELPYLKGQRSYPEPDPTVEGGLIAKMSAILPHDPINLGKHVQALPANNLIPEMPEWCWIHTPGHTPGHVSLFRNRDQSLIAGDAFITVKQDSLLNVLVQNLKISGPPRYLTMDWQKAWKSVEKLQALKPKVAVTGHGMPAQGVTLEDGLTTLATNFDQLAIPDYGRYLN
ncbi:MBL fold metallo-hydrolase [Terrilactibacillus laevilacticus]|uniref:MBL fold metallo-hydrolase n=1 Tax=Terrilactibacillus laevilacticus TaxID=1380157 RepID=A0ABW5PPK6_9BACI|nr:MBL fold metallo-hydrolase [Terrilactibacillus laevilacticus]